MMTYKKNIISFVFVLSSLSVICQKTKQDDDQFAQIGNRAQATRIHLLEDKLPPVLPEKYLPEMKGKEGAFTPMDKMDTQEELSKELVLMREKFLPFMKNYAPEIKETRRQLPLTEFQWRIETNADRHNFTGTLMGEGNWETVNIPHYGPPEGRSTSYYYKEFDLPKEMQGFRNRFICFKGVDYRAKVFINGALVVEHEGFFAPFEFNISDYIKAGKNSVLVKVENDFSTLGSPDGGGEKRIGNKIYAASGLGWDDPARGWHHCPPGMGIYQDCYMEAYAFFALYE